MRIGNRGGEGSVKSSRSQEKCRSTLTGGLRSLRRGPARIPFFLEPLLRVAWRRQQSAESGARFRAGKRAPRPAFGYCVPSPLARHPDPSERTAGSRKSAARSKTPRESAALGMGATNSETRAARGFRSARPGSQGHLRGFRRARGCRLVVKPESAHTVSPTEGAKTPPTLSNLSPSKGSPKRPGAPAAELVVHFSAPTA